jgi:hypothetical protein
MFTPLANPLFTEKGKGDHRCRHRNDAPSCHRVHQP